MKEPSKRFKNKGFYTNNTRRSSLKSEDSVKNVAALCQKSGDNNANCKFENSIRSITASMCNDDENDDVLAPLSSSRIGLVVDLESSALFNTSMCSIEASFDLEEHGKPDSDCKRCQLDQQTPHKEGGNIILSTQN